MPYNRPHRFVNYIAFLPAMFHKQATPLCLSVEPTPGGAGTAGRGRVYRGIAVHLVYASASPWAAARMRLPLSEEYACIIVSESRRCLAHPSRLHSLSR